jgi:RND family efflux transporter MFP subunit
MLNFSWRAAISPRAVDRGTCMAKAQRRNLCLILVYFVTASLAGCQQPNQLVTPPPPKVTVAQPIERKVNDTVEFVATMQATQTVELRSQVKGYLEKIHFEDGSNVKAGDLLFVIEQEPYQLALASAKAEQLKAIAAQGLAQTQYRRMEPLRTNGVVTQEELDVQAAQVATTKADVAAAETAVHTAELNLSYTQIRAPISGRIGRHLVDIGNLIQAQETPLAVIQALDPIYAVFDVSENELLRFMEMLRKKELPDPEKIPPTLHLGLPNEQGFPHEGKLEYRELKIDPSTGTARRRGIFPNPGWQLIPGMFAKISAPVGEPVPRLLVEERALGTDQRGEYLLVVNDKNAVEYRSVKLGINIGPLRVIQDGITAKDWVIINGLQRARPGATVDPERSKMVEPPPIKLEHPNRAKVGAKPPAVGTATPPAAPAKTTPPAAPTAPPPVPATTPPAAPAKTEAPSKR